MRTATPFMRIVKLKPVREYNRVVVFSGERKLGAGHVHAGGDALVNFVIPQK